MSFQCTYGVYDLDFDKTYETFQESKDVSGISDISKGSFIFWLSIQNVKVRIQISNKGNINIWHSEKNYIDRSIEKLKLLVRDSNGDRCKDWVLVNLQKLGSTKIASPITEEISIQDKMVEANREEIKECMNKISEAVRDGNIDVLSSRVDQLRQLSERKRVAHFPKIIKQIKVCLESPILVNNFEPFEKLVVTLSNILFFEQHYKPEKWNEIIAEIQNKISPKAISTVMENPEFPDSSIITFLGKSGRKEAVEAIFEKIKNNPSVAFPRSDISHALAELYFEHKRFINQELDALLKDKDKTLVELAKKRRREIMQQRSIFFS